MIDTPEYRKAREIASWFMGYPSDEDDARRIEEATPLQAMNALEKELRRLMALKKEKERK